MSLISQTLDDMGHILWGPGWRKCLERALDVTEDDVKTWETDLAISPAGLQEAIQHMGRVRIPEIEILLAQMKQSGFGRGQ